MFRWQIYLNKRKAKNQMGVKRKEKLSNDFTSCDDCLN